jgi:DNA-binding CsgD family transcriptional regulator
VLHWPVDEYSDSEVRGEGISRDKTAPDCCRANRGFSGSHAAAPTFFQSGRSPGSRWAAMDSPEAAREPWLDSEGCPKLHRRTGNSAPYFKHEHRAWRSAEIYARRGSGLTLTAIAREFQLSRETVREIARRMERKAKWRAAQLRGEHYLRSPQLAVSIAFGTIDRAEETARLSMSYPPNDLAQRTAALARNRPNKGNPLVSEPGIRRSPTVSECTILHRLGSSRWAKHDHG